MSEKHKTNITLNCPDETTLKFSLNTDEHFLKLIRASKVSGKNLHFQGKQIENLEINNKKLKELIQIDSPEIVIRNPPTYFTIKIGNNYYSDIPFNYEKLPKNRLLYTTTSAKIGVKIEVEIEIIENKTKVGLTISAISDNIHDLLKLEKTKKEWADKDFEIKIKDIDVIIAKGKFSAPEYDDGLIEFYERIDNIDTEFNLNLKHPENYEITKEDIDSVKFIEDFLKYKKISFDTFTANLTISHSMLNDIVTGKGNDIYIKNRYKRKLMNKEIKLGKFEIRISEPIFLNFKEIHDIYKKNKKEQNHVNIRLIIMSKNPEENCITFL